MNERKCKHCGELFTAGPKRQVCDACRVIRAKRIGRHQARHYNKLVAYYLVEYDPIPVDEGGFKPGSSIMATELEFMLQGTVRGFATGTILRHRNGTRYVVRDGGPPNDCQKIIRITKGS